MPIAEVGVLSRPLTGSNAQVTPHLRSIPFGNDLRKRYSGHGLHRRHRGLYLKGKMLTCQGHGFEDVGA